MKKPFIILLFFFALILQVPSVSAWAVPTHYEIVEKTYHALPSNVQSNLNLQIMIGGSDDPDLKFFDYNFHHYPLNQIKADYWLNRGKEDYKNGNYKDASYSFGVASHYISDGCCAPHCDNQTSRYGHSLYEIKALILSPNISYNKENIDNIMETDEINGKISWENWSKNENDFYIQNDLDRAGTATYSAIMESVT